MSEMGNANSGAEPVALTAIDVRVANPGTW